MRRREPGTPDCSRACLSMTGAFIALAVGALGSGELFLVPLTAPPLPKDAAFHPDTGCCKEQGQRPQEANGISISIGMVMEAGWVTAQQLRTF